MSADYYDPMRFILASGFATGMEIQVVCEELAARSEPSFNAKIVSILPKESRVTIREGPEWKEDAEWFLVDWKGGTKKAWVPTVQARTDELTLAPTSDYSFTAQLPFNFLRPSPPVIRIEK